jgi:hypothetical protein
MPKGRPKKLNSVHQLDGKIDDTLKVNPNSPTTLDEIMGEKRSSRYKTTDVEVYAAEISDLNGTDLNRHAISIGIIPHDDKQRLIRNLIARFNEYHLAYNGPKTTVAEFYQKNQPKVSAAVLKILGEGR